MWNLNIVQFAVREKNSIVSIEPVWNLNKFSITIFRLLSSVSIEPVWNLKTTYPKAYMFKFHTGSMLTKCDYLAYISDKEFKFHTGSMLTNQKRE